MQKDTIVITGIARTPQGKLLGALKDFSAVKLGAAAIRAAIHKSNLSPADIQEVIMGCVLAAGQGQAPARQAALAANIPVTTLCTTVNKMCGFGYESRYICL